MRNRGNQEDVFGGGGEEEEDANLHVNYQQLSQRLHREQKLGEQKKSQNKQLKKKKAAPKEKLPLEDWSLEETEVFLGVLHKEPFTR